MDDLATLQNCQARLAARLQSPPERALAAFFGDPVPDPGRPAALRQRLLPGGLPGLPDAVAVAVRRADEWAAAADRAGFPPPDGAGQLPAWQRLQPGQPMVISHPLTGQTIVLKTPALAPGQAQALALAHLQALVHTVDGLPGGAPDLHRSALAMWRFGPEIKVPALQDAWPLLPADCRLPDHTVWDHQDFSAALAAAFVADPAGGPALLAISLGPVQDFIAAARSTSDLWAGSHLLSRLAWEAMKVICEALGPEAIVFPRLRGVPQVDLWLRDAGLDDRLFEDLEWAVNKSDANPLFAAALPNRFTALVPACQARSLAEKITSAVRHWVLCHAEAAYRKLLKATGIPDQPGLPGHDQIVKQLQGFPEVHWAAVPFSLVATDGQGHVDASGTQLATAMQPFFAESPPGYLGSDGWKLLRGGLPLGGGQVWRPKPATLYPALHDLLERVLAAAKAVRPFEQTTQCGWRCSLTGETEWITTDRKQLCHSYRSQTHTLWAVNTGRFGIKAGEHLGAPAMLKRLWPSLFASRLQAQLGIDIDRFVVSTHTMAVAGSLARWLKSPAKLPDDMCQDIAQSKPERVALPGGLRRDINRCSVDVGTLLRLPGWLDAETEADRGDSARRRVAQALGAPLEAYYGLLLMDGDRMGAWLSADRTLALPQQSAFHPDIRHAMQSPGAVDAKVADYAKTLRAATPGRHMAISEALNHFSLRITPAVVERQFHGKLIYAGGDDVLALLPAAQLLPAAGALRSAYSGDAVEAGQGYGRDGRGCPEFMPQGNGFVLHQGRLLRLMGSQAHASCGLVIAHHQAPLAAVLRELHAAERRAKNEGGRNAWSLSLIKRSGGIVRVTAKWGEPALLFEKLRDFLADSRVSRRAVYNTLEWLKDLPPDNPDLLGALLAWQLARQADKPTCDYRDLASRLMRVAGDASLRPASASTLAWLRDFMIAAEFLARDARSAADAQPAPHGAPA